MTRWEVSSDREEAEWNRIWTEELKLGVLLTELGIWNGILGDFSKVGREVGQKISSANQQCISRTNRIPKQ